MAITDFEESIKYGVERALYQPIADCLSVFEWAKIGMNSPRWISVKDKEKLPKGECIAYSSKFDEMIIGYIEEAQDCNTGYRAENNGELLDEVTHWMPKPKPPKEGEVG